MTKKEFILKVLNKYAFYIEGLDALIKSIEKDLLDKSTFVELYEYLKKDINSLSKNNKKERISQIQDFVEKINQKEVEEREKEKEEIDELEKRIDETIN